MIAIRTALARVNEPILFEGPWEEQTKRMLQDIVGSSRFRGDGTSASYPDAFLVRHAQPGYLILRYRDDGEDSFRRPHSMRIDAVHVDTAGEARHWLDAEVWPLPGLADGRLADWNGQDFLAGHSDLEVPGHANLDRTPVPPTRSVPDISNWGRTPYPLTKSPIVSIAAGFFLGGLLSFGLFWWQLVTPSPERVDGVKGRDA